MPVSVTRFWHSYMTATLTNAATTITRILLLFFNSNSTFTKNAHCAVHVLTKKSAELSKSALLINPVSCGDFVRCYF